MSGIVLVAVGFLLVTAVMRVIDRMQVQRMLERA